MSTVLPDVLASRLKVVFCGTAAGTTSAARGAYYAGRGNKFWPVLHRVGLTPRCLAPVEFRDLLRYGIGLTDLAQKTSGTDKQLKPEDFDVAGFRERVLHHAPRILAFNGKKAAAMYFGYRTTTRVAYGMQNVRLGSTILVVLPSTSGSANSSWNEAEWMKLADYVRSLEG
jgi:TDG/mug DNA glycosylase family protein